MKKILCIVMTLMLMLGLTACMSEGERLEYDIQRLQEQKDTLVNEIDQLEFELDTLQQTVVDTKIEQGTAKYVLTINIKQSHFTLDIGEHLKDAMNDISIQIPVDKEYYDSVNVGDVLDDSFRLGSFVLYGSWGNWKVTIADKKVM